MIDLASIYIKYQGRVVISGVSLKMLPATMTVVVGSNGAGKTTLIKAINGSVAPSSGTVKLNGRDVKTIRRREIARNIAVVAQENETKFPVSVEEYVLAGRYSHGASFGWETPKDIAAVESAIRDCSLTEFAQRDLNQLSGGERQRCVMARALAAEPKYLLLDEPTANLDISFQAAMLRLVRDKCKTKGLSALVVTHDLELAAAFADELVMLKAGRIAAMGEVDEVLTTENIRKVFGVEAIVDTNPMTGKPRVNRNYDSISDELETQG